jgi:uncharacterized membrane protein YhaH (DUF805 family)
MPAQSVKPERSLLFEHRGALGRRPFLVGMVVLHAGVLAAGCVCDLLIRRADRPEALVVGGALAVLLVGWLWALSALIAKRLRSLWLNPVPVLAGFVLIELIDQRVLIRGTDLRFWWPVDANTPLVGALVAVFWIVLFLCPASTNAKVAVQLVD